MIAFFDTEYVEKPLQLASIAIIRDDGEELYRVATEPVCPDENWYFKRKVWKHIKHEPQYTIEWISAEVTRILRPVSLLVTRSGEHDRKLIEMLVPNRKYQILDLQDAWEELGRPQLPPRPPRHHALEDAQYHRRLYDILFTARTAA